LLRISKWELDFNPYLQKQTHVHVWIHLLDLPQEYCLHQTLTKITNGVGIPLLIDEANKKWALDHYVRILVDVDFPKHIFEEVIVKREGCVLCQCGL